MKEFYQKKNRSRDLATSTLTHISSVNFPYFQHHFIHLRNVVFMKTDSILLHFPYSVRCLSFQSYTNEMNIQIKRILIQRAKFLTHIKLNDINIFQDINTSFPELIYLTTGGDELPKGRGRVSFATNCVSPKGP